MTSDPALLDAFRKQCRHVGAGLALLAWQGQEGVDPDDLVDIVEEFDADPTAPASPGFREGNHP